MALELSGDHAVSRVREVVGPRDVDVAQRIRSVAAISALPAGGNAQHVRHSPSPCRPGTLRAKYGVSAAAPAVHCTDLAEDGPLDSEYLFALLPAAATSKSATAATIGAGGGGATTVAPSGGAGAAWAPMAGVPSRIAGGTTAELLGTVSRPPGVSRGAARAIVPGRPTPGTSSSGTVAFSVTGTSLGAHGGR